MRLRTALAFDDVLLTPQSSHTESREDVNLSVRLANGLHLAAPVFVAPMDMVCGPEMAMVAIFSGCSPVIHRADPLNIRLEGINYVAANNFTAQPFGVAIGPRENWDELPEDLPCYVCLDTANGHNSVVLKTVERFAKRYPNIPLMAGNVATGEGAMALVNAGASMIRAGIGGGAYCLTRVQTGHGLPTFQTVVDCHAYLAEKGVRDQVCLIADGGVRNSGDAVKALAAGADTVMVGTYFAGSSHTPGTVVKIKGKSYKTMRGMASAEAKGAKRYVEGASGLVPYKGSSDQLFTLFLDGLRSGCAYSGASNLAELRQHAEFVQVTHNGTVENSAHGLKSC